MQNPQKAENLEQFLRLIKRPVTIREIQIFFKKDDPGNLFRKLDSLVSHERIIKVVAFIPQYGDLTFYLYKERRVKSKISV